MNTMQRGIITLIKSAVTGEKLPLPEGFSLEEAEELIKKQSILPLAYQGAVQCGIPRETQAMQRLFQGYVRILMYHERQMRAVERLFHAFEENGIDYMPLKGVNMKTLFPKPELRTMGDADVLIRQEQYDRIAVLMEQLGYRLTNVDEQVYTWDSDALHLELHIAMVQPLSRYYAYYGTGWKFARRDTCCRYRLSVEDEFVFLFAHFARHYRIGGIGCRHVLDLYVHRRACPQREEHYIEQQMEKLNLLEFYRNMKRVLAVWFENTETDATVDLITEYIFSGGTFGSEKNRKYYWEVMGIIKAQSTKNSRAKMTVQTIFPPLSYMQRSYPVLRKAPYLLPVMWVVRFVRTLLFRPASIKRKADFLSDMRDDDVEFRRRTLEVMGIRFDTDGDVR